MGICIVVCESLTDVFSGCVCSLWSSHSRTACSTMLMFSSRQSSSTACRPLRVPCRGSDVFALTATPLMTVVMLVRSSLLGQVGEVKVLWTIDHTFSITCHHLPGF